ncbi:MAG: hypothetical protein V1853_03385 [bacterium]
MSDQPETKKGGDDNVMAAVSYIWVVSLIMLLTKKDSKFVTFHARQGFVLFVASIIFSVIAVLVWANLIVAFLSIIGIIKAYQGEWWKMPLVSNIAEKINF